MWHEVLRVVFVGLVSLGGMNAAPNAHQYAAQDSDQYAFGNSRSSYHAYIQRGDISTLPWWVIHDRFTFWAFKTLMAGTRQISFGHDGKTWHAYVTQGTPGNVPSWAWRNTGSFFAFDAPHPGTTPICVGLDGSTYHAFMLGGGDTTVSSLPSWSWRNKFCFHAFLQNPTGQPDCSQTEVWWYDIDGAKYNCKWYAEANRCKTYGSQYHNKGLCAQDACCACGKKRRLGGTGGNSSGADDAVADAKEKTGNTTVNAAIDKMDTSEEKEPSENTGKEERGWIAPQAGISGQGVVTDPAIEV